MTAKSELLAENLRDYLLREGVVETDVQRDLRAETARLPEAGWQIAPEQGQMLSFLVRLIDAGQILEIGTFTGYGALSMAMAQPQGGRLVTLEGNPEFGAIAERYWQQAGLSERIELRDGMALDILDDLVAEGGSSGEGGGRFDLVFIDADKKEYGEYYERALILTRAGGLIVIDNMLWGGAVADSDDQRNSTKSIRALTRKIREDSRVHMCLIPIGDGVLLVQKQA